MASEIRHFMDEADIGSGEKSAGHDDVQRDVESVRAQPEPAHMDTNRTERILRSGTHLARITVRQLADQSYEAQVYVRLAREPDIAETYIPAGIFVTEAQAWAAAQERAMRALKEHEF